MRGQSLLVVFAVVIALALGAFGLLSAVNQRTPVLQTRATTPVDALQLHLVGVHVIKEAPDKQFVAHHYCQKVSDQVTQCAVFDSGGAGARLIGIEYIIPGDVYRSLLPEEQQYWHPHTYEVDGALLRAPEVPLDQEQALLASIRDTYGRTWHLWASKENPLPLGKPDLAWSILGPGQLRQDIEQELKQEQQR